MSDDYKLISELTELTTPATTDVLPIVDVSDTTDADSGTTKKIKIGTIVPAGGTTGKVLKKTSGDDYDTEWGDGVSVAAKGDIQTYDTAPAKLAVGTNGQLLTADDTQDTGIKWADAPVAVSVTTKGDVQTHDGTDPSRLAVGTDGHVLTADAASTNGIKWAEVSGVDVTTKGDIQTHDTTDPARLAVGTDGKLLSADSSAATGLAWVNSYEHWIMNETPTGDVNGSNTAYDTASNYIAGKIEVFKNGQKLTGGGADYTETDSNTITMVEAPLTGDVITVNYLKGGVAVGDADTLSGASLSTDGTLGGNSDTDIPTEKAVKTYVDSGTVTMTNKRIDPRIVTAASYTTDTGTSLSVATADEFDITAQAGALKFNNPGGTPVNGQKLIIRIKDDGTARALTYDTQFRALTDLDLPTTTIVNQTLYMEFIFNSADTKWDLIDMSGRINFKVGTFDRDIATASGTQAITGVGFKPKYIEFRGCIAGGAQSFNGVSDGTTARCIYSPNFAATPTPGLFQIDTSNPIAIVLSSSNYYSGVVNFNDDGFTITWTKTGTPTGNANIIYTAYR